MGCLCLQAKKACSLLTDDLITGSLLRSELAQEKWFQVKASAPISLFGLVGWLLYFKHLFDVMTSSFWVKVP